MIPDLDTMQPMLGTSLGVGGGWNLPLTRHWLALTRAKLGKDKPPDRHQRRDRRPRHRAHDAAAGASAVGIASVVMMRGFELIADDLKEFEGYLAAKGLNATDLIGRAADERARAIPEMPPLPDNWRNMRA